MAQQDITRGVPAHHSVKDAALSLAKIEDADTLFILAGVINVDMMAMQKRRGRTIYGPSDIRRLLSMIEWTLTEDDSGNVAQLGASRGVRKMTVEEEMAAVTAQVAQHRRPDDDSSDR